jgi:hypothetical protein
MQHPKIPQRLQKRLLRMISARADADSSTNAFSRYSAASDEDAQYHFFTSMVLAYCRPFTENFGLGSLLCEYPSYPDYPDEEMNVRHQRMMDLRNTILGHSSIQGTKIWLLAPGAVSPFTGQTAHDFRYAVGKLTFHRSEYVSWLHDIVTALVKKLDPAILSMSQEIGSQYLTNGEVFEMDTGTPPFAWKR